MHIEIPETTFSIDFRTKGRTKFVPLGKFEIDSAKELLLGGKVTYYSPPSLAMHWGYIYIVEIANLEYRITSTDYQFTETYLSA